MTRGWGYTPSPARGATTGLWCSDSATFNQAIRILSDATESAAPTPHPPRERPSQQIGTQRHWQGVARLHKEPRVARKKTTSMNRQVAEFAANTGGRINFAV